MPHSSSHSFLHRSLDRRQWLQVSGAAAGSVLLASSQPLQAAAPSRPQKASIAITLDLEMSAQYPRAGMTEWNYEKGNLDEPTKAYALKAAKVVKELGGRIHFFCVGRVLEQPNIDWLLEIIADGHAVGNHTYDHVNVLATKPEDTQFRFQRAPWLTNGQSAAEIIRQNIRLAAFAMRDRLKIEPNGFRTPGGFSQGLHDRLDVQQLLLDEGYRWVSATYPPHDAGLPDVPPTATVLQSIVDAQRLAQPLTYPSGLVDLPMSPISDVHAFRTNHWSLESFTTAIERGVRWAIEHGAMYDFLAHPSCLVVEDPECQTIRRIGELVQESSDRAELVTLDQIAQHHLK